MVWKMPTIKENLRYKIKEHELICRISGNAYSEYDITTDRREFYSRIKQIHLDYFDQIIDTSNKPDMNIVILTVDCLRDSQLLSNKYFRDTTPFIDSLRGSKFIAVSSSCWTYPSVPSILTGLYPHNYGAIILSGKLNEQ
ncbi:MAG: Sulfatase [Methanothrix harundinacea]|jgi:glucan phosphoethanolaminetransferase (alkaline phosphatase superfamily)|uniref:Sulfatase n=1 Tax=Methanothrix harundinacea TaxID=301375 RepID=A0A101FSK3_9EURY|nr:MAG: Sulfatase [Methanothrix harundinacea]